MGTIKTLTRALRKREKQTSAENASQAPEQKYLNKTQIYLDLAIPPVLVMSGLGETFTRRELTLVFGSDWQDCLLKVRQDSAE